jgi:hypothetical protein
MAASPVRSLLAQAVSRSESEDSLPRSQSPWLQARSALGLPAWAVLCRAGRGARAGAKTCARAKSAPAPRAPRAPGLTRFATPESESLRVRVTPHRHFCPAPIRHSIYPAPIRAMCTVPPAHTAPPWRGACRPEADLQTARPGSATLSVLASG